MSKWQDDFQNAANPSQPPAESGLIVQASRATETETKTTDTKSDTSNRGAPALKPEMDPFKRLMNKLDGLIASGLDDDLLQAYEMTKSTLMSGRFAAQYDKLADVYDNIHKYLADKPELQQILHMTSEYNPDAPAPGSPRAPGIAPAGPALRDTAYNPDNPRPPEYMIPKGPDFGKFGVT